MKTDKEIRREIFTGSGLYLREASEGEKQSREIEGYAILFNTPSVPLWSDTKSEAREVIAPEAITRELLDGSDIKLTMFHDNHLVLGRSRNGEGTLSYEVDEKGVKFRAEMPNTADGDKALELVKRGDISGCSFAFSARYGDRDSVSREVKKEGDKTVTTYTVREVTGIYDFTLALDPAYPQTSAEVREQLEEPTEVENQEREKEERIKAEAARLREIAARKLT